MEHSWMGREGLQNSWRPCLQLHRRTQTWGCASTSQPRMCLLKARAPASVRVQTRAATSEASFGTARSFVRHRAKL
eukprot:4197640-Pleurochrysis_carterae.AAC.1